MRDDLNGDMFECVPEIDFTVGYRYFLGNMDNYSKALMSMLKSIKSKLLILKTMNITQEYEGLRIIAQTLRKMLSNIGATQIAESAYELETALLNNDFAYLQEHLMDYIICLEELSQHLELLLKKMNVKGISKSEQGNTSFLNKDFTKTEESIKLSTAFINRKII